MAYYTTESGSGVFSSGTMYWTKALLEPLEADTQITADSARFAATVTENLLTEMAAGPLGVKYPARANLGELAASASTASGTGGPIG